MNLLPPELPRRPVHGELSIHGVTARGPARRGLLARLLLEDDAVLEQLRGVASPSLVVVVGPAEHLPWFEGAIYLQQAPDTAGLLLPTGVIPKPSGAVLLRALSSRAPGGGPLVALPDERVLVPLAEARPLARERLREQLESLDGQR